MSGKDFAVANVEEESKFVRKARESPFMIIGLVGLVGACGMGIYKYKTKGAMSTSVYLMQLRVIAQGTVIGSLSIGIIYSLVGDFMKMRERNKHN